MNLQEIISEADTRVANSFDNMQKVTWLNELNQEFFDVVKIPAAYMVNLSAAASQLANLPTDVRGKNIVKVQIGKALYPSYLYDNVPPGQLYHVYDEGTRTLTLSANAQPGQAVVKYFKIATTTFVVGTLTAVPDAPSEYHWLYVLGLCEKIAKAMDDVGKANNYANDYRGNLMIAQQNFSQR